jgi:hypothetical protein
MTKLKRRAFARIEPQRWVRQRLEQGHRIFMRRLMLRRNRSD